MLRYIVRRVFILIPTLLAVIFIIYGIMSLTPGSPAEAMLGQNATPEAIKAMNHEFGYDQPFLVQYANYVIKLCQGDMGKSFNSGRPVFTEITQRFPTTLKLATAAIILAIIIGIPIGIISAVRQYGVVDVTGTVTAMFMASIPGFWLGLLLIILFSLKLGLLPATGADTWRNYIMPSFTLALPASASMLRLTRTTMLETVRQDYVRTARSKGQRERKVILRHALKNALLPVITVAGMNFGLMLGGAMVIEQVFSINGVGTLMINSIRMKDIPQVTGCALCLAFLFTMIMLLIDIVYAYIDPRIKARYQHKKA